jgi:hypothetical protein
MLAQSSSAFASKDNPCRSAARDEIRALQDERQLENHSISVCAISWESFHRVMQRCRSALRMQIPGFAWGVGFALY